MKLLRVVDVGEGMLLRAFPALFGTSLVLALGACSSKQQTANSKQQNGRLATISLDKVGPIDM